MPTWRSVISTTIMLTRSIDAYRIKKQNKRKKNNNNNHDNNNNTIRFMINVQLIVSIQFLHHSSICCTFVVSSPQWHMQPISRNILVGKSVLPNTSRVRAQYLLIQIVTRIASHWLTNMLTHVFTVTTSKTLPSSFRYPHGMKCKHDVNWILNCVLTM